MIRTGSTAVMATCLLLAACGTDDVPATETAVEESCSVIPSVEALPSADAIAGKPFIWKDCNPPAVRARFGHEDPETGDGDHCTISITDTQFKTPEQAAAVGADGAIEQTKSLLLGISRMNVEMLVGTRETLLKETFLLQHRGGPSTLPVVDRLATGDEYAVAVPRKGQEPTPQPLLAVIRHRYALEIKCTEAVRNHDQAAAMYRPYVEALQLDKLP